MVALPRELCDEWHQYMVYGCGSQFFKLVWSFDDLFEVSGYSQSLLVYG